MVKTMKKKNFEFTQEFLKSRGLILGTSHLPYNPKLVDKARELRKNMTNAEEKLWFEYLRDHKYRFYRQRPIDNYIVDFYCAHVGLVIEVDGGVHDRKDVKEYDKLRSLLLETYNLDILRFRNEEIFQKFRDVCEAIDKKVAELEEL